jgi:hypothetical protein
VTCGSPIDKAGVDFAPLDNLLVDLTEFDAVLVDSWRRAAASADGVLRER